MSLLIIKINVVDKTGPSRVIITSALLMAIFSPPLFIWLSSCNDYDCILPQSMFSILTAAFGSALPVTLCDAFPAEIRYTGIAFSYNAAQVVFGGTAPIIATELVVPGKPFLPGLYLSVVAIITVVATLVLPTVILFTRDSLLDVKGHIHRNSADSLEQEHLELRTI
uniref:Major facilitator superfamily (MFS) profile domain-containing protein n=2 Tax=Aplanochytrium stocchinoi TaxID=215587 RepID=A0A7S3PKS3_9STRA